MRAAGARVTVVQRFRQDLTFKRESVDYTFVADGYGPILRGWQFPLKMSRLIKQLTAADRQAPGPTIIHLNGLLFPVQAFLLRLMLPQDMVIVAQHHAERPWPSPQRICQRWGLKVVDGFLFTTRPLAREWIEAGVIRSSEKVYEVMETSTPFQYQDRATARARTGLEGQPVILWTGSLTPNKDPLTVLAGVEKILDSLPDARLYMAYLHADLLPRVKAYIGRSLPLRRAVTLLGGIPHAEIETYYNSADIFVQGSHSESAGIALLEAMACGVVPVVTDIPSFRVMTANGQIGELWPVGQSDALADALLTVAGPGLPELARASRHFFQENWRFSVIGRSALSVYNEILAKKRHGQEH